jgi:hypothetical protein
VLSGFFTPARCTWPSAWRELGDGRNVFPLPNKEDLGAVGRPHRRCSEFLGAPWLAIWLVERVGAPASWLELVHYEVIRNCCLFKIALARHPPFRLIGAASPAVNHPVTTFAHQVP